jgi:hypothetical protein
LHVKILDPERVVPTAPNVTSETAIVCGGSGFVGRFAVQVGMAFRCGLDAANWLTSFELTATQSIWISSDCLLFAG